MRNVRLLAIRLRFPGLSLTRKNRPEPQAGNDGEQHHHNQKFNQHLKLHCTKGSRAAGTPLKTMNTNHNSDTTDGEPEASPTASKNLKDSGINRLFWSTLLLAAGLALFLSAGFWQLDRAAQKRAFITSFNDATQIPALSAPVDTNAGEMLYRRFSLRGNYLPERQVLLDNMVSEGEVGYQVLTPFKLDTELGGQVLLVNRAGQKALQIGCNCRMSTSPITRVMCVDDWPTCPLPAFGWTHRCPT